MTVWYAGLGSTQTCIPDGHLHTVTYTRCRIDTTDSPDDEHMSIRNMYRNAINIYEKKNCASSWVICKNLTNMHGQQNIKLGITLCYLHNLETTH